MAGPHDIYVIDASSWISIEDDPAQNRILFFVGKLIEQGKIRCPPEAWDEVEKCPWVRAWLEPFHGQFVRRISDVEYMLLVGRVTHQFSTMAGARRRKERADQYVVATAAYINGTSNPIQARVVCEETDTQRASRKITTACKAFNVTPMNLRDMLREEFPHEDF